MFQLRTVLRYRTTPPSLEKRRLDALVEEAIVDACGDSEQRVGFLTMLEEHLDCPFYDRDSRDAAGVERVDLDDE